MTLTRTPDMSTLPVRTTAAERVTLAFSTLAATDQPQAWIHVADRGDCEREAARIDSEIAAGAVLPLAGLVIAVKDNIDVAGMPTTGASPGALYLPEEDAHCVKLLRKAGAIVLGKTNMDQFATGLVGTRSPYGTPVSVLDPELVSGGSSSGSAVSVALGIVDAALGTDTAGSGRVPAAFNKIVGIKPTLGVVSSRGLLPASPSYDTITVFAADLSTAERVFTQIAQHDPADPRSRRWDTRAPLAAPENPVIAVPTASALEPMAPHWLAAFEETVTALREAGVQVVERDITPLLDAAKLLYGGALVAERTAAFGSLLDAEPQNIDPTVATIVRGGYAKSAVELASNQFELVRVKGLLSELWRDTTALLLPTAPGHPTVATVQADPIGVNSWVGTYTNFVNLLDLSALAFPGVDPVGITLIGPTFADRVLMDLAHAFAPIIAGSSATLDEEASSWLPEHARIAVFGAHLSGFPLNYQLQDRGARLVGKIRTAPNYQLYALNTTPLKPGLVRTNAHGASFEGEEWAVPLARLSEFLGDLAQPMCVGVVDLADDTQALGFLCEPSALEDATNISDFSGWAEYMAFKATP